MTEATAQFENLIGRAALRLWPELPRDAQELVFDAATCGDEALRQALAVYLHDHHPRTAHPPKPTALV